MAIVREEFTRVSDVEFTRRRATWEALNREERRQLDTRLLRAVFYGKGHEELYPALKEGANPDAVDQNGYSGLMHASDKGFNTCAGMLLAGRANPLLEAPAVLRNGKIVSKNTDSYSPQRGDIPVTAPLLTIMRGNTSILYSYLQNEVRIPPQWHRVFIVTAQQVDSRNATAKRSRVFHHTERLINASLRG